MFPTLFFSFLSQHLELVSHWFPLFPFILRTNCNLYGTEQEVKGADSPRREMASKSAGMANPSKGDEK